MALSTIAVTGATGMLGRHVVLTLAQEGFTVIPMSRKGQEGPEWRGWDLRQWHSPSLWNDLFAGVDAVVHSAAVIGAPEHDIGLGDYYDVNVRACAMLGEWALGTTTPVVFISSSSVYEHPEAPNIVETDNINWSGLGGAYSLSKILAEDVFARLRFKGLQVATIRPSSLYGTGEPSSRIVSRFLRVASAGDAIELEAPYDDAADFVHAADVAQAVVRILRLKSWGSYNIGSGSVTTFRELAHRCVDVAGRGSVMLKVPDKSVPPPKTRFQLNCREASGRLGYSSGIDLVTGLKAVLEGRVISVGYRGNAHG